MTFTCVVLLCRTIGNYEPPIKCSQEVKKSKGKRSEICNKDDATTSSEVSKEDTAIDIRPLTMEDFKEAKKQVTGSSTLFLLDKKFLKRVQVMDDNQGFLVIGSS